MLELSCKVRNNVMRVDEWLRHGRFMKFERSWLNIFGALIFNFYINLKQECLLYDV